MVGLVGPPGIGKSRLVREVAAMAGRRGVEVFTAYCESHTNEIPFHAVARLLRAGTGVEGLDAPTARARIRAGAADADAEDLLLLDDLLGIGDPDVALPTDRSGCASPAVDRSGQGRGIVPRVPGRLCHRGCALDRRGQRVDAGRVLDGDPQTPLLVLVTYRPEYQGALGRVPGAQTIALAPLRDSEAAALITRLFGSDPSIGEIGQTIAEQGGR